jgi:1,4-alpha-glucan branching enzyme
MNDQAMHAEAIRPWSGLTAPEDLQALAAGRHPDPFAILGPHVTPDGKVLRAFFPGAHAVRAIARATGEPLVDLQPDGEGGVFTGILDDERPYSLMIEWADATQQTEDPYSFGLLLSDDDLHLFSGGSHWRLAERFGAQTMIHDDAEGVLFSVWAPNARRVAVVGDFNSWDGRRNPMRLRVEAGVWEIFIPQITPGALYKFEVLGYDGQLLPQKADPLARQAEHPPATASVVVAAQSFCWSDADWMQTRAARHAAQAPIAIYEVHAGSWLRPSNDPDGTIDWCALADRLIPYVVSLGFTHIELLPIMEYPFGGSWGYQPISLFAPTARYGTPADFARFVSLCHEAEIGVILDWVPAHFPTDAHGLAFFDGTHLYEHADPRQGVQQDWNTLIYDLGRTEVQGFLIASALHWLEQYHIDGLRVDAVAAMLYRDYSRRPGEWTPNIHGGRENLEAVAFLRRLNETVRDNHPGTIIIAEESTAWPGVSAPVADGGLGFAYKWNMGWMHDSLSYLGLDPIYRAWHHDEMTFGLVYAFSERFILPLSHDEFVHGKGSLYSRAPGDPWQKRANLRVYFAFMWTHPGKKLLFMGCEIGQQREWNHDGEIDWSLLDDVGHAGLQVLVRDLNMLYRSEPALHEGDAESWGFEWVIGDARVDSVFAYIRRDRSNRAVLVVLNMTPVLRETYRVGVPLGGTWHEILNSDACVYGGSNASNAGRVEAAPIPAHGHNWSMALQLPPLAALVFRQ